jgi:hypothetical protein
MARAAGPILLRPASPRIFRFLPVRIRGQGLTAVALLAGEMCSGLTLYLENAEHAHGKTFAAKAATYGIAKHEEISYVLEFQTRRT